MGSHLVRRLRDDRVPVRAVVRATIAVAPLRRIGCDVVLADVRNRGSLTEALAGCGAVVHLVAILRESGDANYEAVNRLGTANVAAAARAAGVDRMVHLSALGAAPHASRYLRSKWAGEEEVRRTGIRHVIFRPSFIIGSGAWSTPPGRGAAAQFADVVRLGPWYPFKLLLGWGRPLAWLAALTPVLPILGAGRSRFMPVHIDDLLTVVRQSLERDNVLGETYELGGPDVLAYDEMMDAVAEALGVRRWKVHLPLVAARGLVRMFSVMPNPPMTRDEFESLLIDNVCDNARVVQTFGLSLRPFSVAMRDALERR